MRVLALVLIIVACSDDPSCPADVDIAHPAFEPRQAGNGATVDVSFEVRSGKPDPDCRVVLDLDCGGVVTRYRIGVSGAVKLDCSGVPDAVECRYTYTYPDDNPNNAGIGAGPVCIP